jgi:hypothetical protein
MLLTRPQTIRFWHEWSAIVRLHAWGPVEAEIQRYALLKRAGFDSLTQVDKLAGYDSVLAELAAISKPNDLEAQMREANMPRTRLLFAVGKLSTNLSPPNHHLAYACTIARDKFGTPDLESLADAQLLDLRNTLAARLSAHRRKSRSGVSPDPSQLKAA